MPRTPHVLQVAILATLLAAGCQPALACREPYVDSFTAEGVPDALCDVTFNACEDGSLIGVNCSNSTFDGDYHCTWYRSVDLRYDTGEFDSPDFCVADTDTMVDELGKAAHLKLTVE